MEMAVNAALFPFSVKLGRCTSIFNTVSAETERLETNNMTVRASIDDVDNEVFGEGFDDDKVVDGEDEGDNPRALLLVVAAKIFVLVVDGTCYRMLFHYRLILC